MNLEKRVKGWNECITSLTEPWGFLIGAELTIVQGRISLVTMKISEPKDNPRV